MIVEPVFINFIAIDFLDEIDNISLKDYCLKNRLLHGLDQNEITTRLDFHAEEMKPLVNAVNARLVEIHKLTKLKSHYNIEIEKAWCNIDNNINIDSPHCHPLSVFSVVYYVEGDEDTGSIQFLTPNAGMMNSVIGKGECVDQFDAFNSNAWTHNPEPGKLLIFPSWLTHFVHQNKTDKQRISIAFDTELVRV